MAVDATTVVVAVLSGIGSAAASIWTVARKVQSLIDRVERLDESQKSHENRDKEIHKDMDAFMEKEHESWLELNRTLGYIRGRVEQQDWSETTGSTIMRPREKSRPDR